MEKNPLQPLQTFKSSFRMPRNFREFEKLLAIVLGVDALLFLLYLVSAAKGIGWLKVTLAVLAICVAVVAFAFLVLKGELTKVRSLWLVVGFAAVFLCLVVSLLLRYPRPAPTPAPNDSSNSTQIDISSQGGAGESSLDPSDAAG